jgi:hypothetical protein
MRTLIAPKYSSKNFTFVRHETGFGGVFTIEMSTLQALGGIRQVWNDSADAGFVMVSDKTGVEAVFVCTKIQCDVEQDVVYWELSPTFSSYNQPGGRQLQHVTVKVYNT